MSKRDFREKKVVMETATDTVEEVVEVNEETATDVVEEVNEKSFLKLKKQFSDFKLNVREEASMSSTVITQITNNDSIELVSNDINAEWYKVKINGSIEGCVMSQYVEKSE